MAPYRYEDHPHPHPSEQVEVRCPFPCGHGVEWLRAHPLGHDCYRILTVPFHATEVGLDDIVLALPRDEALEFHAVLTRHSRVHLAFELPRGAALHRLHTAAQALGAAVEHRHFRQFAANLPSLDLADEFVHVVRRDATRLHRVDHPGFGIQRTRREGWRPVHPHLTTDRRSA